MELRWPVCLFTPSPPTTLLFYNMSLSLLPLGQFLPLPYPGLFLPQLNQTSSILFLPFLLYFHPTVCLTPTVTSPSYYKKKITLLPSASVLTSSLFTFLFTPLSPSVHIHKSQGCPVSWLQCFRFCCLFSFLFCFYAGN